MANYIVTTLQDQTFGGGNLAAETADGGGLSLREALGLALANGAATTDTIAFASNLGGGTLTLTNGELTISSNVTISGDTNGDRRADLIIDGNNSSRVFHITAGTVALDSLAITGGKVTSASPSGVGGGVYINAGANATISNSTLSNNSAFDGGGIATYGSLTVINSTISGNSASHYGGGVVTEPGGNASATLINTTVADNFAGNLGGGIDSNGGPLTLINSTVTGNSTGGIYGGINAGGYAATVTNSIVAGNADTTGSYQQDISAGAVSFTGVNVIGVGYDADASDGVIQASSLEDLFADVGSSPYTGITSGLLANNGGVVATVAIKQGGQAQNAGITAALPADVSDIDRDGNTVEVLPFDGRGMTRVVGASVDIGAVEFGNFQVTTLSDSGDDATVTGDLTAEMADGGGLSLREALLLSNADPDDNSITFSGALAGGTLTLVNGEFVISSNVTISGDTNGDNAADITIDGNNVSRDFHITGGTATLASLTIVNGNAGSGYGGGVYVGSGTAATVKNSTLSNNAAQGGGGIGSVGNLTVINSTLSGNFAFAYGGGVAAPSGATLTTLINITVTDNYAGIAGGGVLIAGGSAELINSTVTGNLTNTLDGLYGGVGGFGDTLTLTNSIVAGNDALSGYEEMNVGTVGLSFTGVNVIGVGSDTNASDHIIQASSLENLFANVGAAPYTNVASGVLANNGGPVATVLILTNGTANNAGTAAVLPADTYDLDSDGNIAEPLPVDARGLARVTGGSVDIGAVELQTTNAAPTAVALANTTASIAENTSTASHIKVADINVTDDGAGTNTLGLAGTDSGSFEIVGTSLYLKAGVTLDYETKASYSVAVTVDDTTVGATPDATSTTYTLNVSNVNEAPTAVALANTTAAIAEDASTAVHIKVADINVTDDALGTNTLSLSGADLASFEIVGTSLYLKAGVTLDYETKSSYSVAVTVDDTTVGATPDATSTTYTLNVSNVNEPPNKVSLVNTTASIAENTSTASHIKVADINVTDDALGTNTLGLSGADLASFEIVGTSLYLKAGVTLDYETKASYSVAVTADDTTVGATPDTTSLTYTLNVSNVNEAPTAVALANTTASIAENTSTASHIKVADINVTDDALGTNTLGLSGADLASFEIVGTSLYLKAGVTLDYETKSSYSVKVTVDDTSVGATPDATSTTYTLNVSNVNEAPVNTVSGFGAPTNKDHAISGLSVSDVDATSLTTTLHVDHGTLAVLATNGAVVGGSGTATVTLTGSVAQIDAALNATGNVVYHSAVGFIGVDQLTMTTTDGGSSGTGGAQSDSDTVSITVKPHPVMDFNGDGQSDLLWRHSGGTFTEWQSTGNGFALNVFVDSTVSNLWTSEGAFDFSGDGRADLVWRDDASGYFTIWNSTGNGFTPNSFRGGTGSDWKIAALADFNGDGFGDMLFRNTADGTFTEWQSTGTGFTPNVFVGSVDNTWHLAAAADFNGDGKSDLLWRNDSGLFTEWQSNGNGFTANVYVDGSVVPAWHILGTGDFNGDGKADLLFRHDQGYISEWQSTGNGFTLNVFGTDVVGNDWKLAQTGDFNGDGKDDLIFRNDNGVFTEWQSTGNSFNANVTAGSVGTDWKLITPHYDRV